jgi:hypothetical protein
VRSAHYTFKRFIPSQLVGLFFEFNLHTRLAQKNFICRCISSTEIITLSHTISTISKRERENYLLSNT